MSGTKAAEFAFPERRAGRRQFERAAQSFSEACFVHDEARARLLGRLEYFRLQPTVAVDLGTAHGRAAAALKKRYPAARVLALDSSPAMLTAARASAADCELVLADAESIPLQDDSVDLVFANLLLPWCRPEVLFADVARVLKTSGMFLFTTLGPDSLLELRQAWAGIDDHVHVHGFIDMHDIGDIMLKAGLEEPVIDVDRIDISYRDLGCLASDLKRCGGRNVAGGRRRSLTAPGRWKKLQRSFERQSQNERISVSIELIFGHAFGPATRRKGETIVPIEAIRREIRE